MVAQIDRKMIKLRPGKVFGRLVSWALVEGRPLTTSGRWINNLVFAGYGLAKHLPAREGAKKPIFIIGTGRSGTTVLGRLFSVHRQVVFLNEPKAIWHYVQGDEDIAGNYTTHPARIRLDESDAKPEQAQTISRIYSTAMRAGFAERVVDKYPELLFRLPFVRALFPQARYIALQRDGVHTCSSISRWSKAESRESEIGNEDWWGLDSRKWHLLVDQLVPEHDDLASLQGKLRSATDDRDRAAVEWILSSRELRKVEQSDDIIVVKYEELCEDPAGILGAVLEHLSLEQDEKFIGYAGDILEVANTHGQLDLMPELVAPFKDELIASGYGDSAAAVRARAA